MPRRQTSRSFRPKRYAVVVAQFNEFISQRLLDGCLKRLVQQGVKKSDISVSWVPGSFELPVCALAWAKKKDVAAVICLGAVIRGETFHFELVAQNAAQGILQVSLMTGKPCVFGVLTTDTVDQAYKRSDPDGDHKGMDAADTALAMVKTLSTI